MRGISEDGKRIVIEIHDAEKLFETDVPEGQFILIDSSVLCEVCDLEHPMYQSRVRMFERLSRAKGIQFRFPLATRLYTRDFMRRRFLTDFLRGQIKKQLGFNSSTEAFDELVQERMRRCPKSIEGIEVLTDADISHIRSGCFGCFGTLEEGIRQWQFICQIAMGKKLEMVGERLVALGIRYIDLKELGVQVDGKQPQWRKQEELMVQYGLNSSDTAIVSLIEATDLIFGLLSNAQDLVELLQLRGHLKDLHCYSFNKTTPRVESCSFPRVS